MKHFLKIIYQIFFQHIFNFRYLTILYTNYSWFLNDYKKIKIQKGNDRKFDISSFYPILTDRNEEGGTMTGHYFH